jgi:hypothetical protein
VVRKLGRQCREWSSEKRKTCGHGKKRMDQAWEKMEGSLESFAAMCSTVPDVADMHNWVLGPCRVAVLYGRRLQAGSAIGFQGPNAPRSGFRRSAEPPPDEPPSYVLYLYCYLRELQASRSFRRQQLSLIRDQMGFMGRCH